MELERKEKGEIVIRFCCCRERRAEEGSERETQSVERSQRLRMSNRQERKKKKK